MPEPVDLPAWPEIEDAEARTLALPADNALLRKRRADQLLESVSRPHGAGDLRLRWIVEHAPAWKRRKEKNLIFVATKEALDVLKRELEFQLNQRVAVFHEQLSPGERDIEVAQFAGPEGPAILVSTEAGGEGRNFEFCRRLILFDLPWDPVLVEQRIGRLDRINRRRPVEIVYFRPHGGFGANVVELYERLGILTEPLGGLERSLSHVEKAIRETAATPGAALEIDAVIEDTRRAREAMSQAVYHHLHQNRYRPELAQGILARIPPELEDLTETVVTEACRQFGFDAVDRPEQKTWYIEFGATAVIEYFPGAPVGSRWLGTFDRETAVIRESLDFFASGHPLVEGVLMELEDGHRGQVALLSVEGTGIEAAGLLIVIKKDAAFRSLVIDTAGNIHPEWEEWLVGDTAATRSFNPAQFPRSEGWAEWIRTCFAVVREQGKPVAAAAFVLGR